MLKAEQQNWALPLDPLQRAAASDESPVVLVLGDSGTGKTQVLVAMLLDLLGRGVDPRSIAYFTCTELATLDVRTRMDSTGLHTEATNRVFVGSVQEYAALYWRYARPGGQEGAQRFTVWDQEKAVRAVTLAWDDQSEGPLKLSVLRLALRWNSDRRSNWGSEREISPDDNRWAEVARVYEGLKLRYNVLDADDLVCKVAEVMGGSEMQGRTGVRFVFVDGLESLRPSEYRLVMLICGDIGKFIAAADPMQACRSIAGRDPRTVERLYWENRGLGLHRLKLDHLSSSELWRLGKDLLDAWKQQGDGNWRSITGGTMKGMPLLVEVEAGIPDMNRHAVDEAVRLVKSRRFSYEDMAFLYRDESQIEGVKSFLIHRNLPFRVFGEIREARTSDVQCALHLMARVLNPHDLEAVRVAAGHSWPGRKRVLGKSASTALMSLVERHRISAIEAAGRLSRNLEVDALTRRDLGHLLDGYEHLMGCLANPQSRLPQIFDLALHWVRSARVDSGPHEEELETEGIRGLCRSFSASGDQDSLTQIGHLLEWVSPALRPDRVAANGRGLTCSTMEHSRGMCWPVVFILDVRDRRIPGRLSEPGATREAELRQLYIGLKRATERLYLYCPADIGDGQERQVSRFLDPLRSHFERRLVRRFWGIESSGDQHEP